MCKSEAFVILDTSLNPNKHKQEPKISAPSTEMSLFCYHILYCPQRRGGGNRLGESSFWPKKNKTEKDTGTVWHIKLEPIAKQSFCLCIQETERTQKGHSLCKMSLIICHKVVQKGTAKWCQIHCDNFRSHQSSKCSGFASTILCFDVSDEGIKVTVTSKIIFWKYSKLVNPWQKMTSL